MDRPLFNTTQGAARIGSLPLGTPPSGQGLQRWLYGVLRQAMLDGRLPAGSTLPSTRSLALQQGLARGTVQAAYDQLVSEGYLLSQRGSGTRVSQTLPDLALRVPAAARRAAVASHPPVAAAMPLEGPWLQRVEGLEHPFPLQGVAIGAVPFAPHRCDVAAFPIDTWRKLHVRHLRTSRLQALWDSDPAGVPALREAIAVHLGVARGVSVSAAQIVVLGSVQQALDLCTRLLVAPGDAVWMEDPGYPGARQVLLAAGAQVVDVPVDPDGMRVEDGLRLAPQARLAYVTPSRQAPLGVALSPERRLALLRWAQQQGACIFEDDYDSEYRFVARPIPALKSLPGADAHVVLAGTFSKLLFPALRLAYVALPTQMVDAFTRAASLTARHANGLAQTVLADFMADGHFDRHVRRMRKLYAARAAALEQAAHTHWRGVLELPTVHAGLDVVGRLVDMDERTALRRLAAAGVQVAPLGHYTHSHHLGQGLVMGFAPLEPALIDQAARQVAQALRC